VTKSVWHCHIAMSLDGKIARSDGSFDWLMPYPPQEFDIDAFHAEVDAVVMGRDTYEIERGMGEWPHAGKPVFVVTSRPIEAAPSQVEARSGIFSPLPTNSKGAATARSASKAAASSSVG
jgi:dihydrofolate reductase